MGSVSGPPPSVPQTSSPDPGSFQGHMRQAGNRLGTRNADRQAARGATGTRPEVQLTSVQRSENILYFGNINEEGGEEFYNAGETAGVLRGGTPTPTPSETPSEQLRQDMQRRTGSAMDVDVSSRPPSRFRPKSAMDINVPSRPSS